jgi:mitofusin
MSQEYKNGKGKSAGGGESSSDRRRSGRPQYVTVGSGSTSESAARLQALLDNDSGYGGSLAGDDLGAAPAWNPSLTEDRPTPAHSPMPRGTSETAENDRRVQANAIHQLWYNQHRVTLARSINNVVQTLKGLQEMNAKWPATYPSVQRT